jgi:Kef-type K+ transport system membrane component KefB
MKEKLTSILKNKRNLIWLAFIIFFGFTAIAQASGGESGEVSHGPGIVLLWIAIILIAAKTSSLIEKIGQPSVLGELIIGVILGNLALVGIHALEPMKHNEIISFLSQFGVIILLFMTGLESNVKEMTKVGVKALMVAVVGVILPFVAGYLVGPLLLPGLSTNAYLFLGATLTATSVGITARVFKDLKYNKSESKIVLGAAVFDDVLGLIILAVVSAIVTIGSVSVGEVGMIVFKAVAFLIGSIFIGQWLAPVLGKGLSRIHTGVAMKFTLAIVFALLLSYLAELIGLAPIIGAFAAGLILDPVHFKYFKDHHMVEDIKKITADYNGQLKDKLDPIMAKHSHRHIEDLIEPVGNLMIPIFFVMTGMVVDLQTLFNPKNLLVAIGLTIIAIIGKVVAGFVAGKENNKWIIGFGMVPRGEVGLIFAVIGKGLGVVTDSVYSVIVIMVILTTLVTPPILTALIKKQNKN